MQRQGGAPGCAASLISTSSLPCGPSSLAGVTATVSRACGMASAASSTVTAPANLSAACRAARSAGRPDHPPGRRARPPRRRARTPGRRGRPARQASRCVLRPGEDGGKVPGAVAAAAERADQPAQLGAALLHDREPGRVGLHRLDIGGELGGRVGDDVRRLGHAPRQPGQRRVVVGCALQRAGGTGQQRRGVRSLVGARRRVADQRLVRRGRGRVQRVGVRQPFLLGQQVLVLACDRLAGGRSRRGQPAAPRPAAPARGRVRSARLSSPLTSRCRW